MGQKFCQSCGMPLTDEIIGTNADGTKNHDYCMWCFLNGEFLQDVTMEGMIDHCLTFLDEMNAASGRNQTPEEARAEMMKYYPMLKRWQQK